MSTVDKMLIKGIRSFDPDNKHVITFFKPLTLIVGPNGAGKTVTTHHSLTQFIHSFIQSIDRLIGFVSQTIIECLKLSCTGELPPNARSGHSFIHDPKVKGETETKGQIKLRFKTAAGKDVVCIRSFQLTQKASKMEYKAIESIFQSSDVWGHFLILFYRCADMDREIPALMGVSKAVLENVIFAHQDDANWPLQDPATLKKKFDDIFSATRYTKALEVIKKLHKDQAQEIKSYKLKLEHLQTLKDAAYKLRENIAEDQAKTESLKGQILELEKNIQKVETKIQQAETTLKDLRGLQDQISTKTTTRSTLFKLQQAQYAALAEENEDTDEELKEWQTKFEERIALLVSKISKLEREMNDMETKSSFLSHTIKDTTREIGKLQHEADANMSLKHDRDTAIQRLFVKHNLGFLPTIPFSDDIALNLTNRVKSRLTDLEKDLNDKKKSNEIELNALWASYVAANDRYSEVEAQKQAKAVMKAGFLKRIKDKEDERDLAEHQLSNLNLLHIDEREKNLQIEVEKKTLQIAERDFESNIQQKRTELFHLEQKIKSLYREKDVMASDSEYRVKLDLKKGELESRKKKHKKMQANFSLFLPFFSKFWLPSDKDLKKEITQALGKVRKEYEDLNSKSVEAEKEVKVNQLKIQDAQNSLSKLQKDMDARRRFVDSKLQSLELHSSTIDSFPEVLLEVTNKRDDRKSKYNMADGMRQMFEPFEKVARARHFCPCCERPFTPEEEDEFVKKQRVKATSSAEHLKVLAVQSTNAESHFLQLDKLRIVHEEHLKLGKETIPQVEKNLKELNEDLDEKSQALDDVVGVLAQIKSEKDLVETLIQPLETADRLLLEMRGLQEEIDDLESKLDARGQGVRTMEEIQSQLSSLQSSRDTLNNDLQKLWEEQTYMNNDLSNIQMRWHSLREEKSEASNMLHKVKKAEEDLERLAEDKEQVELEEKHLVEALVPLSKEKDKLLHDHKDLKFKLEREFEEQAELRRSYQQEVETLFAIASKIKEYKDSKKGERLKENQEKLSSSESQLQSCEAKKQDLSIELNKSKELMRNQDQLKRNIDDNLNYRKTKAEVDELTSEIESLEDRIVKTGGVPTFEADLKKYMQEKERLRSELDRCHGTLSVYQSNISKHKLDLKQAQYNDIDKRYFNQLIQLKTTEMANKDLDRYYNALDKALMRFHTMKMEEINKIIRELWQQTYRGQDIDYISIHSASEGAGTRSYSYRVLMQTGDAELEMRGRCSAGQKVLASLIIRLALAETFCLNCGILALDEPTTNLDGPNAESLAAALLRIMEDRKGQENFQLIVITHDERFAQLIGQRQHAERYYRVTKDENQHSIIESQEIFD
ncbi:hypothetical protein Syun_006239 [Stephania yunnanensis]|uniref:DNA repair protein RAD50 n=1 Tax=Stephania yunnanensis TaxID=152371 RepID=A0AAP0KW81_9MAGN